MRRTPTGLTLVELLVVAAVISMLVQLLLPAVQAVRESARRIRCASNVRQLALATTAHVTAHGRFPTGGWNWRWLGDPERGFGRRQPGGWIYNILPYMDADAVRTLPVRRPDVASTMSQLNLQPAVVAGVNCPTRRGAGPFARRLKNRHAERPRNGPDLSTHARSDYAINGGDVYMNVGPGPISYAQTDSHAYRWPRELNRATGIAFPRSLIRPRDIRDGLSRTYLIGEKYLSPDNYESGLDFGDDGSMLQGDDMDITRWTSSTITDRFHRIEGRANVPRPDWDRRGSSYGFGSAHRSGWNVARCDGSVRHVSYHLAPAIHRSMGNRKDGRANQRP